MRAFESIILFEKEDGKDTDGLIVEDTGKNPGDKGENAGGNET